MKDWELKVKKNDTWSSFSDGRLKIGVVEDGSTFHCCDDSKHAEGNETMKIEFCATNGVVVPNLFLNSY